MQMSGYPTHQALECFLQVQNIKNALGVVSTIF